MTNEDTTHERHAEDWHEWSVDFSDRNQVGEIIGHPMRLFVRNQDGAIEIVEAAVTSRNPGARELDQCREAVLFLQRDTAEWLHGALGKALAVDRQIAVSGAATSPICGRCCHTNDMHAQPTDPAEMADCAICSGVTSLRIESYIVERILAKRIEALHGLGEK